MSATRQPGGHHRHQRPTAAVAITAIADDTGTAGDFTTSDTTLTVSGTNGALGAGEKVQVSNDGGSPGSSLPGRRHDLDYVDPATHAASSPTRRG